MLRLDHDQFMADVLVKHGWTPPSGAELVAGKPGWQVSGTAPRLPLNWPLHLPLNLSVVTALPLQLLQLSRTVLPRPSVTVAMWRTCTRSPKPQPELPRLSGPPHSADHHCSSRESGHELPSDTGASARLSSSFASEDDRYVDDGDRRQRQQHGYEADRRIDRVRPDREGCASD